MSSAAGRAPRTSGSAGNRLCRSRHQATAPEIHTKQNIILDFNFDDYENIIDSIAEEQFTCSYIYLRT